MISILLYILLISLYNRLVCNPIIFLASIIIGIILSLILCVIYYKYKVFEFFTIFIIGINYFFIIFIFSVFGPVFIDRSISYHIAFYAVEKENIEIKKIETSFGKDIFDKRMNDAIRTGFIVENKDIYSPSTKAKIMYYIMYPIGKITNSLDTYNDMKNKIVDNIDG